MGASSDSAQWRWAALSVDGVVVYTYMPAHCWGLGGTGQCFTGSAERNECCTSRSGTATGKKGAEHHVVSHVVLVPNNPDGTVCSREPSNVHLCGVHVASKKQGAWRSSGRETYGTFNPMMTGSAQRKPLNQQSMDKTRLDPKGLLIKHRFSHAR